MDPFVILVSLFGPFLVWPIEYFLNYPFIIEELFKAGVVFWVSKDESSSYSKTFLISGICFALTETAFYAVNINYFGRVGLLFTRFGLTSILHSFTFLVIYFASTRGKYGLIVGFLLAAFIHYLYNRYIPIY